MNRFILALTALLLAPLANSSQAADPPATSDRIDWFREAKFGMFVHWGLYAVPARGEWEMHKSKIPVAKYAQLATRFNPTKYNAEEWVRVAKDAGMKYIVITAKHHDGFAMFGSKVSPYNIVDATPFKRDPLKELAAACQNQGIRLGFYYSHAQDWHHPGGAVSGGAWDSAQKGDFDLYLKDVAIPQIKELLTGYGPTAVLWCDTPWNMTPDRGRRIVQAVREVRPETLINSRLMYHGNQIALLKSGQLAELKAMGVDYLSYRDRQIPQQGQWRDWETCMTLNQSWGYTKGDNNWKSPEKLVRQLVEVASKGGNFLLNIGPTAEGEIPPPSIRNLKIVGEWLKVNGEAIYGARSLPGDEAASVTATASKTSRYLFVIPEFENRGDKVADKRPPKVLRLTLTGAPRPRAITLLGESQPLKFSHSGKMLTVEIPAERQTGSVDVVKVELEQLATATKNGK